MIQQTSSILLLGLLFTVLAPSCCFASDAQRQLPIEELAGLTYVEVLTGSTDPDEELPMLIVLHFIGTNPVDIIDDYADLDVPARVIIPAGPYRYSSIPRYHNGRSWFPDGYYDWDGDRQTTSTMDVAARLASFVRSAVRERPTIGKPVVTGYSQGGDLVHVLTLKYPHLLSGALPMGARFPHAWYESVDVFALAEDLPAIYIFHGVADEIVPLSEAVSAKAYFSAVGGSVQLLEYAETGHEFPEEMKFDYQNVVENLLTGD